MNKRAMIGKALEYGIEIAGGALAGYVEGKYPTKTLWQGGPGLGVGVAAAGLAIGMLGIGGKYSKWAGDMGAGAAAYEVGKSVLSKTAPASASTASQLRSGVRGVGALPSARTVSQAEIRQALRELSAV